MRFIGTRWLGVGLAAVLAVVTLGLAVTGRLGLYINPDSTWFAVSMAVFVLVGTVASFVLPLGAEADHDHDHAHASSRSARSATGITVPERGATGSTVPERGATGTTVPERGAPDPRVPERGALDPRVPERGAQRRDEGHAGHAHASSRSARSATGTAVVGGVAASGVVLLTLALPPASLSAELAMSRDVGAPPLFGGTDVVTLASTGDTASFGVGEWATVFATATDPEAFDGDPIELTGFVTPGEGADFDLTRLVITHCVIDAQPASLPVAGDVPATGQWVTVTGTVRASSDGTLRIDAASIDEIPEPQDPYEY